jgi:hypothetical protein
MKLNASESFRTEWFGDTSLRFSDYRKGRGAQKSNFIYGTAKASRIALSER